MSAGEGNSTLGKKGKHTHMPGICLHGFHPVGTIKSSYKKKQKWKQTLDM